MKERTVFVGMGSAWPCLWLCVRDIGARKTGRPPDSHSRWWGRRPAELLRSPCIKRSSVSKLL